MGQQRLNEIQQGEMPSPALAVSQPWGPTASRAVSAGPQPVGRAMHCLPLLSTCYIPSEMLWAVSSTPVRDGHQQTRVSSAELALFCIAIELSLEMHGGDGLDRWVRWPQLPLPLRWPSLVRCTLPTPLSCFWILKAASHLQSQVGSLERMFSTRQNFKGNAVVSRFACVSQFDCGRNLEADTKGWAWKNV